MGLPTRKLVGKFQLISFDLLYNLLIIPDTYPATDGFSFTNVLFLRKCHGINISYIGTIGVDESCSEHTIYFTKEKIC